MQTKQREGNNAETQNKKEEIEKSTEAKNDSLMRAARLVFV